MKGLLLGLAFAGGSADASAYLSIGHAFPANMTGNTVLIALAAVRGAGSDALRSGWRLAGVWDWSVRGRPRGAVLARGRGSDPAGHAHEPARRISGQEGMTQ